MKPDPTRRPRGWRLAALYLVFLLVLLGGLLAAAEAVVRGFVPAKLWQFRDAAADWQRDADLGWTNIGNLSVEDRNDGRTLVRFETNEDGLQPRSAAPAKDPGRFRVMLFGDSAVVGRAVPEADRLVSRLGGELAAIGIRAEVISAGVQGYSTDQGLLSMRRLLPRYRPDLAIHMVCDNDFGGNESGVAFGHPKPRFTLRPDGSLEFEPPSAENAPDAWKKSSPSSLRQWLQHSALYRLLLPGIMRLRAPLDWRQANLTGLGPDIDATAVDWRLFDALLAAMKTECDKAGAAFLLTQHPHVSEVWAEGRAPERRHALESQLVRAARAAGVDFCPVVDYFLKVRNEGPFHLLPRDPHCNARGYAVTARILAEHIAAKIPKAQRAPGSPHPK